MAGRLSVVEIGESRAALVKPYDWLVTHFLFLRKKSHFWHHRFLQYNFKVHTIRILCFEHWTWNQGKLQSDSSLTTHLACLYFCPPNRPPTIISCCTPRDSWNMINKFYFVSKKERERDCGVEWDKSNKFAMYKRIFRKDRSERMQMREYGENLRGKKLRVLFSAVELFSV